MCCYIRLITYFLPSFLPRLFVVPSVDIGGLKLLTLLTLDSHLMTSGQKDLVFDRMVEMKERYSGAI